MSFWKLATETIGTKGVMVVIAIAFGFYVSSHISAFKADLINAQFADVNAQFAAVNARLDKQNELLLPG